MINEIRLYILHADYSTNNRFVPEKGLRDILWMFESPVRLLAFEDVSSIENRYKVIRSLGGVPPQPGQFITFAVDNICYCVSADLNGDYFLKKEGVASDPSFEEFLRESEMQGGIGIRSE